MKICPFCKSENSFYAKICQICGRSLEEEPGRRADLRATGMFLGAGDVLGNRYEILELIGSGGMGVVYKASDRARKGELIAIKVLTQELASDERAVEDLINEANIAMRLSHPHIMRLHNFEDASGYKFLVMEYVEGPTLDKVLAERKRLSEEETVFIARQVCEGLAYAHSQKVVHRDLKPSNLMLTRRLADWQVSIISPDIEGKICDFGIARIAKDSHTRITGRMTSGTLIYMSPEQIRGKKIDTRSDIYSLGCMLYEFLKGEPPFHTGDITYQHLHESPTPIDSVSQWLNGVVLKCLEKDSSARWQSADELKLALEGRVAARPGPKPEPEVIENIMPEFVPSGFRAKQGTSPEPYTNTGLPKEIIHEKTGIELVFIPAGRFQMGSPSSEKDRLDDEGPVHTVRITKPFYLGKYEVTQGQWQAVMGTNPSYYKGSDQLPVEMVSWNDCQDFLKRIGGGFRLPSEAEWEYACRAGTQTRYCFGDDESDSGDYAWYNDNSGKKTHPVGQKRPNAWGLYDMYGNLWEWCQDWYHDSYAGAPTDGSAWDSPAGEDRVVRGGCWASHPCFCRSAARSGETPRYRTVAVGLRLLWAQ